MTYLPPIGATNVLVCGDTGLAQHGFPLSDDFSAFTWPIWGTDLHCDSILSLLSLSHGWEAEGGDELTEQPEPHAIGTKS